MKLEIIGGLVALLVITGLLWRNSELSHKLKQTTEIAKQQKDRADTCEANQLKTEKQYDDLQDKTDAVSNELVKLKRMRGNVCVKVDPKATSKHDAPTAAGGHAKADGVESDWLFEYGAKCETYRLQLLSCQDYVTHINQP